MKSHFPAPLSKMWGEAEFGVTVTRTGRRSDFTSETEAAVVEAGCPFAFAVWPSDVTTPIASANRFALPGTIVIRFPTERHQSGLAYRGVTSREELYFVARSRSLFAVETRQELFGRSFLARVRGARLDGGDRDLDWKSSVHARRLQGVLLSLILQNRRRNGCRKCVRSVIKSLICVRRAT